MHPPRTRLAGELTFMVLLLVLSLFMLWTAYGISKFESLTSAGAFPMAACLTMVVCALLILRRTATLPQAPGATGEGLAARFVRQLAPPVIVAFTVAIAVYMLALERLGFLLSSYVFLVASMWILGSRRLVLNLVVSAISLAAIYVIFQTVFSVVLPTGTWLQGMVK